MVKESEVKISPNTRQLISIQNIVSNMMGSDFFLRMEAGKLELSCIPEEVATGLCSDDFITSYVAGIHLLPSQERTRLIAQDASVLIDYLRFCEKRKKAVRRIQEMRSGQDFSVNLEWKEEKWICQCPMEVFRPMQMHHPEGIQVRTEGKYLYVTAQTTEQLVNFLEHGCCQLR